MCVFVCVHVCVHLAVAAFVMVAVSSVHGEPPHTCSVPEPGPSGNNFECSTGEPPERQYARLKNYDHIVMQCNTTAPNGSKIILRTHYPLHKPSSAHFQQRQKLDWETDMFMRDYECKFTSFAFPEQEPNFEPRWCEWHCYGLNGKKRDLLCVVDNRPGEDDLEINTCIATVSLFIIHTDISSRRGSHACDPNCISTQKYCKAMSSFTILNYQQHTEIPKIRALQPCWEILFILNK